MVQSRAAREMQDTVVDETVHLTDSLPTTNAKDGTTRASYAYELAPWETTVIIDSNAVSAFTVYLPPVGEAKGKIYCITLVAYTNAVTVTHLDTDSEDFHGGSTISLNANYDRVALYSDGTHWWTLVDLFS